MARSSLSHVSSTRSISFPSSSPLLQCLLCPWRALHKRWWQYRPLALQSFGWPIARFYLGYCHLWHCSNMIHPQDPGWMLQPQSCQWCSSSSLVPPGTIFQPQYGQAAPLRSTLATRNWLSTYWYSTWHIRWTHLACHSALRSGKGFSITDFKRCHRHDTTSNRHSRCKKRTHVLQEGWFESRWSHSQCKLNS